MYTVIGAVLGAIFLILTVVIDNSFGLSPKFPVFAGEDDFSIRINWFLLLLLPGFTLLGGWIGWLTKTKPQMAMKGTASLIMVTVIVYFIAYLLKPNIESLPNSEQSNLGVLLFYISWLICCALGVLFVTRNNQQRL